MCAPSLTDAMARSRSGTPVRMLARLESPQPAIVNATVLKLPSAAQTRVGAFDAERWLLLVEMPRHDLAEVAQRVADLFGLSPAEVRVLALLLEGHAAADIASRTSTSMPTVRTHIRGIFGKTGVTRQVDLVRLLCGLGA